MHSRDSWLVSSITGLCPQAHKAHSCFFFWPPTPPFCPTESVAPAILAAQEKHKFTHIVGPSTAMGKNVLPRVAAKLNVNMLSEIMAVESEDTFQRPMYAGNVVAKVKSKDNVKVMTVRTTSFDEASATGGSASVEELQG